MSVTAFIAVSSITAIAYFAITFTQFIVWRRIHRSKNEHASNRPGAAARRRGQQKPIIVIITIFQGFLVIVMFILIGTNVVNYSNSGVASLLGAVYIPHMITSLFYTFRLVRLGHLVIVRLMR